MIRRTFLRSLGAAFCGAMLSLFPDLGDSGKTVKNGMEQRIARFKEYLNTPGIPVGRPSHIWVHYEVAENIRIDYGGS